MVRWSRIAQSLPGRTDNEIKNYWRTRIEKKMNMQAESGSRGMDAGNGVLIERSTVSYSITVSSETPSDLVIAESSTCFPKKTTEEIEFQTWATPYPQDDISPQVIPFTEGNYENGVKGEVQGPPHVSEDMQPGAALVDYFKGSDNQLFENSLYYNISVGSLSSLLYSSEFSADGRIPPSSSHIADSPDAFSDSKELNRYSDVLWNMDE